jgi:hypothetical protein
MQQTSACPSCGSTIKTDQQFCGICGTKLSQAQAPAGLKCPSCGSPIISGQQFCGTCGAKLGAVSATRPAAPPPPPPQAPPAASSIQRNPSGTGISYIPQNPPPPQQSMPAYEEAPAYAPPRQNMPPAARAEPVKLKQGMLHFGGALFLALGWLVLIIGSLLSIAYIVLGAMGRGFQLSFLINAEIVGTDAVIVGSAGLLLSLIIGIQFIVTGRLCYSLMDLTKKVHEKGII